MDFVTVFWQTKSGQTVRQIVVLPDSDDEFDRLSHVYEDRLHQLLASGRNPTRRAQCEPVNCPKKKANPRVARFKRFQRLFRSNRRKLAGHILDVASLEQFDGSIEEVSTHLEKILSYRPNSESVEYSAVNAEHGVSITHPILAEEVEAELKAAHPTAVGPDGIKIEDIRKLNAHDLASLFNIWLKSADLPNSVKASRTIFLPKTDGTIDISKCRPITIASTMYRLLSKVITRRLKRWNLKNGIFENTSTLYALLKDAKARSKEICIATLDLAKAFDSVPHSRILRALRKNNVDPESVDLISKMLTGTTYAEIKGLQGEPIVIHNGVRQGRLQACGPAYDFHGEKICILAFADDLTLVADSAAGMKILLKAACDFLEESGMSLNAEKCRTLCISRSPRSRKTFVNPAAKFNISDWKTGVSSEIPSLCATDTFRFLGHTFDGEGKIHIDTEEIRSMLKSVKSAPLKPEQKVALIRSHLLPRLQFLFSTAEADSRKAWLIDSIIRGCVKEILHSVKAGMCTDIFYIPSRDGGMGLTSLGEFSLFSRQKALAKMAGSSDPLSKLVAEFFIERWNIARDPKVIEAARRVYQKKRYQRFFQTYQSGGWNEFSGNTIGNAWLTNGRARGRNFIMAVKFRSNTAATRAENLRGRLGMKECRFCKSATETLAHICQKCPASHGLVIQRHNAVVTFLEQVALKEGIRVMKEPKVSTLVGALKPDVVLIKADAAFIVDDEDAH
ncbi:Retrovirus-related Pol polyprotein from type-2 retrotransposable element R2DM [Trichinella murrelli]|uniref:Retrovirus-related Pol polyprotein from type-2 retrotransposable element R2DM n=2 Tax=Trichinella TaxID=6333 RepID=A0A0V0U5U0_9BILA|nr:Retrovirus-related Pol polyprotein from type-2 retrotransposable element R2DM [Trichinella murrelli]